MLTVTLTNTTSTLNWNYTRYSINNSFSDFTKNSVLTLTDTDSDNNPILNLTF